MCDLQEKSLQKKKKKERRVSIGRGVKKWENECREPRLWESGQIKRHNFFVLFYLLFKAFCIRNAITLLKPFKHSEPGLIFCLHTKERTSIYHGDISYICFWAKNQSPSMTPSSKYNQKKLTLIPEIRQESDSRNTKADGVPYQLWFPYSHLSCLNQVGSVCYLECITSSQWTAGFH